MVGIVLASHGGLAEGAYSSAKMIFGDQEDVAIVSLTPDMGPADFKESLQKAVSTLSSQDSVLFLVDLKGGTPYNQTRTLLDEEKHEDWVLVSGLSLPMVLSAFDSRDAATAREIAAIVASGATSGVSIIPEELNVVVCAVPEKAQEADNSVLKPGTVIGDGKIKTALVRIDSRLLHGQVATAWTKQVTPTRIIVVSDGVAKDAMRKTLITEAAPPGVRANVIPVSKLIEIWNDSRFGGTKALFLFEKPQDVVRALEGGVEFEAVNFGSMAHSAGKVLLNDTLSVDQDDANAIKYLHEHGLKLTAQKVPSDKPQDVWPLVVKAGLDK